MQVGLASADTSIYEAAQWRIPRSMKGNALENCTGKCCGVVGGVLGVVDEAEQ